MSNYLTSNKTDKIMMDSEVLFRRLLAVSKQRDVNLEQVLSHELAPVPPSLFNDDGTMRKTTKADLTKILESNCDERIITLHTSSMGWPYFRRLTNQSLTHLMTWDLS